jgi:sulfatase maturation enzyme AslB (radical SAM superfamily)
MPDVTYKKQNSFVGIRHHDPVGDVLDRIRAIPEQLASSGLAPYQQSQVRAACEELLGLSPTRDGVEPFTLQSYVIEEINRLPDEELPRYLFYRYRYETFPQRRILDNFPPCLQVEPTSVCNYRCVFCYQIDGEFTKKSSGHMGMMSLDTFKRIVDEAAGRCEAITLASRGEPLICPKIGDMLEYASGKFLALKMNTNAWFLDEARCHEVLQADMNTLVFSADAASEPTYSRFRVGGGLDRVVKNVQRFREIRAKHYPKSRTITRVSGVQVPGTPHLDQMEKFWGNLVDQVAFVKYNPWENTYARPINSISTPCSDLWRRMFVWWNGLVNPCDVDYKSTMAVGKATGQSLSDLWRSDGYQQLRERHLQKQRSQCSPCNRCTVI